MQIMYSRLFVGDDGRYNILIAMIALERVHRMQCGALVKAAHVFRGMNANEV
jgi:hypothetical protein